MTEPIYLAWRQVENAAEKLSNKLKKHEDFILYQRIIPLGRGGLVPARLVSKYTGIKRIEEMVGVFQKHWYSIPNFFNHAIIVDDIWDSGNTITALRTNKMTKEESLTCLYGVLYSKMWWLRDRDFFDDRTFTGIRLAEKNAEKWIVFPWEDGKDD